MRLYGAINKVEAQDDGTVRVHGIATTEAVDDQGEIVRAAAMRAALPDYMKFPALREMHQLSAAGTTMEADCGDDGITRIVAHVVDPVAVIKVKNLVYRGFSIGGRVTQREAGNPKTITGIVLNEISLVDRPANPEAIYDCWKSSAMQTPPAATSPAFNPPIQIWACADPSHRHLGKADATKCLETSTKEGADAEQAKIDAAMKAIEAGESGAGVAATTQSPEPDPPPDDRAEKHPTEPAAAPIAAATAEPAPPDTATFIANVQAALADSTALLARADGEPAAAVKLSKDGDDMDMAADDSGKKPYGDVEYADPGHRADGKKRYPVDTEEHIRAAWSYIHMPKNASKYEAKDLASVKAKIAAAWRAKIDSEGPPGATDEKCEMAAHPDFIKGLLVKGLWDVCRAAELLEGLDWLHQSVAMEAIMENDDSPQPARLKAIIVELSAWLNAHVAEETSELLTDADVGDGPGMTSLEPMAMSAVARSLRKTITDTQKVELLVTQFEKAGARHNKSDQAHLDTMAFALHKAMELGTAKRAEMAAMSRAHKTVLDIGAASLNADGREMLRDGNPTQGAGAATQHSTVDTGRNGAVSAPNPTGASPPMPHPPTVSKAAASGAGPAFLMIEAMAKNGKGHGPLAACAHDLLHAVSDGATCKEGAPKPARHNVGDMAAMHDLHTQLCMVDGVTCAGGEAQAADTTKTAATAAAASPAASTAVAAAAPVVPEDLAKALAASQTDNAALTKLVGDIVPVMTAMHKRIEEIAAQPIPPSLVANVGATDATRSNTGAPANVITHDDVAKALKGMSEEESTLTLIKARRPLWIDRLNHAPAQREARDELAARKA